MRIALDGIAGVLFESGILTEQLLENDMPEFVWNSAIAGGWWRFASETPRDIFPERLGHYWVWRDESRDWQGLFRAETAEWQARLLAGSGHGSKLPAECEKSESRRFETGSPEMRMFALPVRKPVRRSARNKEIDSALQGIAKMHPHNHEEVFRALEGRVRPPEAEPFAGGRGWLLGFQRSPAGARAWLSKAWSHLELPPFRRGPKLLQ
jgi:hypothetical protein